MDIRKKLSEMGFFLQYCTIATKYDRHGYRARQRAIIVTDKALYMVNESDFKLKEKFPLDSIKGMSGLQLFEKNYFVPFEMCIT